MSFDSCLGRVHYRKCSTLDVDMTEAESKSGWCRVSACALVEGNLRNPIFFSFFFSRHVQGCLLQALALCLGVPFSGGGADEALSDVYWDGQGVQKMSGEDLWSKPSTGGYGEWRES